MSLKIEVEDVAAVLLTDGWHTVERKTFKLDAYEYAHGDLDLHKGESAGLVHRTGASWVENDESGQYVRQVFCPLNAVLAVRTENKRRE